MRSADPDLLLQRRDLVVELARLAALLQPDPRRSALERGELRLQLGRGVAAAGERVLHLAVRLHLGRLGLDLVFHASELGEGAAARLGPEALGPAAGARLLELG